MYCLHPHIIYVHVEVMGILLCVWPWASCWSYLNPSFHLWNTYYCQRVLWGLNTKMSLTCRAWGSAIISTKVRLASWSWPTRVTGQVRNTGLEFKRSWVGLYDSATVLILRLACDISCLSLWRKNHVSYFGIGKLFSTLHGTKNMIHYFWINKHIELKAVFIMQVTSITAKPNTLLSWLL